MKQTQMAFRSVVLAPITAATTARTAAIDTQGADYATIQFVCGAEVNTNNTNVVLNLKESDTNAATAYVTFNSSFNITTDNTAASVNVFNVDLKGRKRYLQVTMTPDTTTNGAIITSCVSELIRANTGANSGNVTSTNGEVVVVG